MKKKLGKAAIIIIVMAVLIVLGNSLFIIRENQYGIVKAFCVPLNTTISPWRTSDDFASLDAFSE